jgi:hypothetical protein
MVGLTIMTVVAATTPSRLGKEDVRLIRQTCDAPRSMLRYRRDGSVHMRVPPRTNDRKIERVLGEIEKRVPAGGYIVP